jgi:hypothetical protein
MEKKIEIGFSTMMIELQNNNESMIMEFKNDCGNSSMKIETQKVLEIL